MHSTIILKGAWASEYLYCVPLNSTMPIFWFLSFNRTWVQFIYLKEYATGACKGRRVHEEQSDWKGWSFQIPPST